MTEYIDYSTAPYPVRDNLVLAHRDDWMRLAKPGTWWDGATRVAIAAETRAARNCALCKARKETLSPNAVQGIHDTVSDLPVVLIEVIHRVATDQSRLTRAFFEDALSNGLSDTNMSRRLVSSRQCLPSMGSRGHSACPVSNCSNPSPARRIASGRQGLVSIAPGCRPWHRRMLPQPRPVFMTVWAAPTSIVR